jgi:hypothetical protein
LAGERNQRHSPWVVSSAANADGDDRMNAIIYLVGLVVIVLAILSLFGLR